MGAGSFAPLHGHRGGWSRCCGCSCGVCHPAYRVALRRTCRTGESDPLGVVCDPTGKRGRGMPRPYTHVSDWRVRPTGEGGGRTRGSPLQARYWLGGWTMANTTYRVLVSTDLGGDPDDIQSLYRLLHYSDILKVEGLVSSPGPGAKNLEELIRHWVTRVDLDHLRGKGHEELMAEEEVLSVIRQGHTEPVAPGEG